MRVTDNCAAATSRGVPRATPSLPATYLVHHHLPLHPRSPGSAAAQAAPWSGSRHHVVTRSATTGQGPVAAAISIEAGEDGVLCNSEVVSRKAAAEVMKELYGLEVSPEEFIPFTGTGEANFLGGVAKKYGAPFEVESCKAKFFEIYLAKYAVPGSGIGYPGARALVEACRAAGLRTAVASSADLVKVHANLKAADIPLDLFDAVVSADAFERLKPFPDIFLAAAAQVGVAPGSCVVIEDAVAGVQAARAAGMRVIGVTTTMDAGAVQDAAPDAVLPQISAISVGAITGLGPRGGATAETAAPAQSPAHPSSSDGVQRWLNEYVSLPAGYKTTRRDALKTVSAAAGLGSVWVALTRAKADPAARSFLRRYQIPALIQLGIVAYVVAAWGYWRKSLSYASPKAFLNALFPGGGALAAIADEDAGRVAAFKRFIGDLEGRGGGEAVPEFPAGADWLNAPPLLLRRELRGKVLVLDFWTYCCINCMHVLPDLAALEAKYARSPVAVVGVHSAKFDNEKDTEAIRDAVLRYDIRHAVVNDSRMALWRALGVSSWPTLAVVSPQGRLLASLPGEGHRQDLDDILAAALEYYDEQGLLDSTPVPVALEKDKDPRLTASPLRFPGKLAVDGAAGRLYIADSGNNRIVVTDLSGGHVASIGGNGPGLRDGTLADAAFNRPQGVAFSAARNALYVCDTESHAVREVDMGSGKVRTLVGNGVKGSDYAGGRAGAAQQLNSPWDCVLDGGGSADGSGSAAKERYLYVAMAGQHQIWRVDLDTGVAANFSGTGYERNQNGTSAQTTSWAQPSGLAAATAGDGRRELFVADSESSSVRRLQLEDGSGRPCVGGDPLFSDNLFKFGDRDGSGGNALLQHPLAVAAAADGASVYVADSYNHRLKLLDPATCSIRTVAGSGRAGFQDGRGTAAQLSEPGGLAVGPGGRVYIADTNNSLVRTFESATHQVTTLQLKGIPPPRVSPDAAAAQAVGDEVPPGAAVVRAEAPLAASSGEITVTVTLPPKYHLTKGANSRFQCSVVGATAGTPPLLLDPAKGSLAENNGAASAVVRFQRRQGEEGSSAAIRVLCSVYFCQLNSVCLFEEVAFEVPLGPIGGGKEATGAVALAYQVSPQAPVVQLPGA